MYNMACKLAKEIAKCADFDGFAINNYFVDKKLGTIVIHASINGPPDSLYEEGIFHIRIVYQTIRLPLLCLPIRIYFDTKIVHPQITEKGELDLLDNGGFSWKHSLNSILCSIVGLLDKPDYRLEHMCNIPIAHQLHFGDFHLYEQFVRKCTKKFSVYQNRGPGQVNR